MLIACASHLLYAICLITGIQKNLRHKRLNATQTYARAHYQTFEEDYFRDISSMENLLELFDQPEEKEEPVSEDERGQIFSAYGEAY